MIINYILRSHLAFEAICVHLDLKNLLKTEHRATKWIELLYFILYYKTENELMLTRKKDHIVRGTIILL